VSGLGQVCLLACTVLCTACNLPARMADQTVQSTASGSPDPAARSTVTPVTKQSEDSDLALIPGSAAQGAPAKAELPAAAGANQRISVEDAFVVSPQRTGQLVPSSQQIDPVSTWQNLLFLDVRKRWLVHNRLTFAFSDRFNLRSEADIPVLSHEDVINNFREGFLSWEPVDRLYFDLGRINVKSGAALGFNPTDFFKTRAVQVPLTADPSALREDRFGTLMLETQYIGEGRALTVAVAPALVSPGPIYTDTNLPSFNPSINCTNAQTRVLVKGSLNMGTDFSPELLFYRDGNRNKVGANLTRSLGQKIVAYGEWAGGEQSNVIDQALKFGRRTGTIPAAAPSVLPDNPNVRFQNDVAVGASITPGTKITFNAEYHFHEAGFSGSDWKNWFNAGQGQSGSSPIAEELWYIREYANDQQEPIAQHTMFLRADWPSAFVRNLELSGFINTDLRDGSSLAEISAGYNFSDAWSAGVQVTTYLGAKRSDFGSLPETSSVLFEATRYF
jgi:hypothetical protein